MIIRETGNGDSVMMGQTDHSRFVGQLAAHWGNADFAAPAPCESVVRAAMFHDYGWLRYETSPLLDAKTGRTYPFLEVPQTKAQLDAYQWSLDWMAGIDAHSGLIVNMHRTGLWRGLNQTIKYPAGYNAANPNEEIQAFIARNEAHQRRERARLNDDKLWTNHWLIQVWDLLGFIAAARSHARSNNLHAQRITNRPKREPQIGIEGSLAASPLPHHRAYGSVHGGSMG